MTCHQAELAEACPTTQKRTNKNAPLAKDQFLQDDTGGRIDLSGFRRDGAFECGVRGYCAGGIGGRERGSDLCGNVCFEASATRSLLTVIISTGMESMSD